ncbi:MAG: sulfurtransferase TusA family protein [Deltaproteobacteria bacterium]|nr:sulfurtransferase TusA family protein [Deltaproteobacteria bacterium]
MERKFEPRKIEENRYELDVRGLVCPYPQLLVLKALNKIPSGNLLEVMIDNPPSVRNIPAALEENGCKVEGISSLKRTEWKIVIRNKKQKYLPSHRCPGIFTEQLVTRRYQQEGQGFEEQVP